MTLKIQQHISHPTESICSIWSYNKSEKKLKELLGTGFLINEENVALTAKHIFNDYDPEELSLAAAFVVRSGNVVPLDAEIIHKSKDFDIAAISIRGLDTAPFLQVRECPLHVNNDYLTVEYSESVIRLNETTNREELCVFPSTRKGHIVKSFLSNFPEETPTNVIEVSFPVLLGASGAPLMINAVPYHVVGLITHNVEHELAPAQTVTIRDGDNYSEETKYYLPTGRAIAACHILAFVSEIRDSSS